MHAAPARTPLAQILAERTRAHGPITFHEFMRECLYHPEHGYYSRAEARRLADYYTSVDVHAVFGRLLARQLAEMWELLGKPQPFALVECGAGNGRLAAHILDFAERALPEFYAAALYTAVEFSAARRRAHAGVLAEHLAAGRASSAAQVPETIPAGCVFSNELLDALPVHRVVSQGGLLNEVFVGWGKDEFCELLRPPSTPEIEVYLREQGIALQEGQQAEVNLDAARWIEDAGRRLTRGFVLTIDYGHEARELYDERHMRGTLLAYSKHRANEDYYAAPGEQDLTAHVNFTALDQYGWRAGLERTGLVTQTQFLLNLGRGNEFADLYEDEMDEVARLRARLQLKNLISPEGMGETFQVFVQHKGVSRPRLTGLSEG